MGREDDAEIHRLCGLLEVIDKTLPPGSPLREGLQKGAIAIQAAFFHGHRQWVEDMYDLQWIEGDLSDEQRALLVRLKVDPDVEPPPP